MLRERYTNLQTFQSNARIAKSLICFESADYASCDDDHGVGKFSKVPRKDPLKKNAARLSGTTFIMLPWYL